MKRLNKALGFAVALAFVAVACAAPTPEGGRLDESNPSEPTPAKKASGKQTPSGDAGAKLADPVDPTPTPNPTPTSCSGKATYDECFKCCDAPTGGELAKADDAFGKCACGGGQCSTACGATFCAGQQPSAACDTCLTNTCEPAATALCTSAACKAGQQCVETSGCEQKP